MDNTSNQDTAIAVDEMALLKQRADTLGVVYSNNIGIDTLRARITERMNAPDKAPPVQYTQVAPASAPVEKSPLVIEQETRQKQISEQMALVRCRIYNLNPSKTDLHGEIITVANRFIGTVRKFIPFGEATDNGYHIPRIMYNELKSRKFQQIKTKNVKGQIEVSARTVPEYNIEILPQLTAAELEELRVTQAAAERVGQN